MSMAQGVLNRGGRLLLTAGSDLCIAATFLITWIAPHTFDDRMVHKLTFMMLLEFIVVHSTGFLGAISARDIPRLERVFMLSTLLVVYLLFVASFAAMYGGWWPVLAFAALTLPKLPAILMSGTDDDAMFGVMANWAAMTSLYLFGAFATLMYDVPQLGVTAEVIEQQAFGVGGEWPEQPYRVMAFGVIYFTGMALVALVNEFLPRKDKVAEDDKGRRSGEITRSR